MTDEVTATVNHAFGLTGSQAQYIDDATIVLSCAKGIVLWAPGTNRQAVIWASGRCPSAFTTSRRERVIAVAEDRLPPVICIYSYPDRQLVNTLQGGGKLSFQCLAFSRDGSRLVSVSTMPDFQVTIWDWRSGNILASSSLKGSAQCDRVSFDPRTNNVVCTTGPQKAILWKVETLLDQAQLIPMEIEIPEFAGEKTAHVFGTNADLFIGTSNGDLYRYNEEVAWKMPLPYAQGSGEDAEQLENPPPITSLLVTGSHVIIGLANGTIHWVPDTVEDDSSAAQTYAVSVGTGRISQLEFQPDFKSLAVCTGTGAIVEIPISAALIPLEGLGTNTVCDFHYGGITGLAALPHDRKVVSCSVDGTLRVWAVPQSKLLHVIPVGAALTAMAVIASQTQPLIVVGDVHGVVRIYHAPKGNVMPQLVYRQRYHLESVTCVSCDPAGRYIVTAGRDRRLFFTARSTLKVLGYVDLPSVVLDLTWEPEEGRLFACIKQGNVFRITPPPLTHTPEQSFELAPQLLSMSLMKATVDLTTLGNPARLIRKDISFFCLGADKRLKLYHMPEEMDDMDAMDETDTLPPDSEYEGHMKIAEAMAFGPGGRIVATGGSDGMLLLRSTSNLDSFTTQTNHAASSDGISRLCFTADGQYIVTGGGDGSILTWQVSTADTPVKLPPALVDVQDIAPVDDKVQADEPSFLSSQHDSQRRSEHFVHEAARGRMRDMLTQLKMRLQDAIVRNETVPEIERLSRADFLLDTQLRDMIKRESDAKVLAVQEEVKLQNLARELLWRRVKEECYDSMEVKGVMLRCLRAGTALQNFPIRKRSAEEIALVEKIKQMRRIEIAIEGTSFAQRLEISNLSVFDGTPLAQSLLAQKTASPVKQAAPQKAADDDDGSDNDEPKAASQSTGAAAAPEAAAEKEGDLLYHTLELTTRRRRITQQHLLASVVNALTKAFNGEFDALTEAKSDATAKIEERRERILEILKDIGKLNGEEVKPEEVAALFKPALAADEQHDSILKVTDADVPFEKFISPAEQARLAEEARKEAERMAAARGDDIGERGLTVMMDNRLEAPQEEAPLLQELVRPAELMKPVEDMSEEEVRQLKEFQKKEQALKEEREKLRKTLTTEMNKLKSEIDKICAEYDAKVQNLFATQIQVKQLIYELELRIIKIGQALLREEEDEKIEANLEQSVNEMKIKKADSGQERQEIQRKTDVQSELYNTLHAEERALDKNFAKDFGDLRQVLLPLWKRRSRPDQAAATHESLDPFAQFDAVDASEPVDAVDRSTEQPEGCPDDVWDRFIARRLRRNQLEKEVAAAKDLLESYQAHLARISALDSANQQQIADMYVALREVRERQERDAVNLESVFKLKQGQVEVQQAAVVTDYSDSVMIPRDVVTQLNSVITAKGAKKVALLKKIKKLNTHINSQKWVLEERSLTVDDLKLENQQLQLLRVTKELQLNIKGGAQQRQADELRMLQKKAEHSDKAHDLKVVEKKKQLASLRRQIREREEENRNLDLQVTQTQMEVADKQTIYNLQVARKEASGGPEQRAKDVASRRKLMDIAKAQAEEIEFLRDELDRLRQRTFPSFQRMPARGAGI
eukprot:TRINITY_DN491_c0_g1_i6.p1 TRINITY_DN491_c0_g1~~TRINITY_DN491_c0_g1_i6.p1  ORF type:complete len:1591 (-),score=495.77 TRINITY_DN491_c0_g1_i6:849-5621(-)